MRPLYARSGTWRRKDSPRRRWDVRGLCAAAFADERQIPPVRFRVIGSAELQVSLIRLPEQSAHMALRAELGSDQKWRLSVTAHDADVSLGRRGLGAGAAQ